MSRNIGLGAQTAMNICADCNEPSVCTCSLCDSKMCRKHMITHMDTVHSLTDNDSDKTKCSVHSKNFLKTFCRTCRLPLCDNCVTDGGHVAHEKSDLDAILEYFNEAICNESQELVNHIRPFYQKILDITKERKNGVPHNYKKVKHDIKQLGEFLHKEIDSAVMTLHAELDEKEKIEKEQLKEQEDVYSERIKKLDETVVQNRQLMSSNNPIELTKFSSSLAYFHVNPSQVKVESPRFSPITNRNEIKEKILELFGEVVFDVSDNLVSDLKVENASATKVQLLEQPGVLEVLKIDFPPDANKNKLYNLCCINPEKILVGGNDNFLHVRAFSPNEYDNHKEFQKVKITCEGVYFVLASNGVLFYTGKIDRTVKRLKSLSSTGIATFLQFEKWEPRGLAMTSSDHLLVCLYKRKQSKVARYNQTGKIVQEIQYHNEKLLFENPMFICCNKNGDICTADNDKHAIIVVNQFGVFQFSYDGRSVLEKGKIFRPCNMATDHLCNIIVTDFENHKIHLLDKYGQFIRSLDPDAGISRPRAISIDKDGKLWFGECFSGKVKVVQYLK
ncbi:uncharacterized protein LOC133192409 [Saccostrea echinata]|uniref:uncharacterized protein LOC133192409 n=1 Tax=Saccostrea echinata TaxID=191078 RepID=UPI002A7FFFE6|nr:uncharacterized protein LOC133192409 [Saccostrea echinata]